MRQEAVPDAGASDTAPSGDGEVRGSGAPMRPDERLDLPCQTRLCISAARIHATCTAWSSCDSVNLYTTHEASERAATIRKPGKLTVNLRGCVRRRRVLALIESVTFGEDTLVIACNILVKQSDCGSYQCLIRHHRILKQRARCLDLLSEPVESP